MTLVGRLGLAIAAPRQAFALAGDRRHAGRSGADLLIALGLVVIITQLRALVAAIWLGSIVDFGLGARAALHVVTSSLTTELVVLLVAAATIWVAAGSRRELGRAFDVACVVVLPLLVVELAVTTVLHVADAHPPARTPPSITTVVAVVAYGWTAALAVLAVVEVRRPQVAPAAEVPPHADRIGGVLGAIAAFGLVWQVVWVARNTDDVRPMTSGDPAPPFALAVIDAHGALGPPVTLASLAGKVTVLDFWATWCGPCLDAMPHVDAFARRHPEVEVLAVNLDAPDAARALFDARGYTAHLVADDGQTSERYGVSTIPHTVVIDASGRVRVVARGGGLDLERALAAVR